MATSPEIENIPQSGFDPAVFIYQNKNKLLIYTAIILAAVIAYIAHEIMKQNSLAAARLELADASTADDYRKIAEKYPHTVAGGNATVLLAGKLRDDKKYDDAVTMLRTLISQYPEYPLMDGANLAIGSTLEAQGKIDDALIAYQQVASQYPNSYAAPQAMLSSAGILKAQGKIDEARQKLENLKAQYTGGFYEGEAMRQLQLLKH